MEQLPDDILITIAEGTEPSDLENLRLVCKSLHSVVEAAAVALRPSSKLTGAQLKHICRKFPNATSLYLQREPSFDPTTYDPTELPSLSEYRMKRLQRKKIKGMVAALPTAFRGLSLLQAFVLGTCDILQGLPEAIDILKYLQDLTLIRCTNLYVLPDEIGHLAFLRSVKTKPSTPHPCHFPLFISSLASRI